MRSKEAEAHGKLYDRSPRVGDLFEYEGVVHRVTRATARADGTMDWSTTSVSPASPTVNVRFDLDLDGVVWAILFGEAVVGALVLVAILVFGTRP